MIVDLEKIWLAVGFRVQRGRHCPTNVSLTQMLPHMCPRPGASILLSAKEEIRKYLIKCEQNRSSFTPMLLLCLWTESLHHKQIFCFKLNWKIGLPLGLPKQSNCRTRISVAVTRASSMCIRGTRKKLRSANLMGFKDGVCFQIQI